MRAIRAIRASTTNCTWAIAMFFSGALVPQEIAAIATVTRAIPTTHLCVNELIEGAITCLPRLVTILPGLTFRTLDAFCVFAPLSVASIRIVGHLHEISSFALEGTIPTFPGIRRGLSSAL